MLGHSALDSGRQRAAGRLGGGTYESSAPSSTARCRTASAAAPGGGPGDMADVMAVEREARGVAGGLHAKRKVRLRHTLPEPGRHRDIITRHRPIRRARWGAERAVRWERPG